MKIAYWIFAVLAVLSGLAASLNASLPSFIFAIICILFARYLSLKLNKKSL